MNSTFLLGAAEEGFAWGDFLFYLVLFIILMALIKKFATLLLHNSAGYIW